MPTQWKLENSDRQCERRKSIRSGDSDSSWGSKESISLASGAAICLNARLVTGTNDVGFAGVLHHTDVLHRPTSRWVAPHASRDWHPRLSCRGKPGKVLMDNSDRLEARGRRRKRSFWKHGQVAEGTKVSMFEELCRTC